ncbi:hypothetical protein AX15_007352 [Amanita polypyramis BW_CC]|nr:hypothetical protein AX15_007352 [Amanita polypyramis BW_CC]
MASSSSKALNAILPRIATSPYEAHQKARTFAARYVKAGQYDVAIDVLFQSARELLKNGQPGSGTDLVAFLLEVYDQRGELVTDESRGRITQLIALTGPEGAWRKTQIDKAIAWTVKHGSYPSGDPELHRYVGELLYKEGDFEAAEPHLLASGTRDSARLLAEMFIQWASAGGSPGAFALRGTLPYLLNGNILAARTFIQHFTSAAVKSFGLTTGQRSIAVGPDEVMLTKDSVLNFAQMAVLTCQRANGESNRVVRESWIRLCGTYQGRGGILTQPDIRKLLHEIGMLYFALPPPRGQAANPFGDMMSSLFGGAGSGAPTRRVLALANASAPGYVPFLYTVYESAYNLRLEECTKCHAFVDPYVEHDSLTLLLDLILLKRGVYRHLLYNRGSEPRKASSNGKDKDKNDSPRLNQTNKLPVWLDGKEKRRWVLVLKLGIVLIFLDAYIRWCHLNPNPPSAGSPWTLDLFFHFIRVLIGCIAETIAFHSGIGLMCYISLALLNAVASRKGSGKSNAIMSDIRREFRFSLIPLTLFYSSLTKLFLLYLLTIWRPSTMPISPPLFSAAFLQPDKPWKEYALRVFVALDDDKIDKEWFIRNIVGGMSAGFGLRVILDAHPLLTTFVIVIGWTFKTFIASMISHWVGGSERTGDAWLAYSIP